MPLIINNHFILLTALSYNWKHNFV